MADMADTEAGIAGGAGAAPAEQQRRGVGQKRRKDGGIKQSGGKEGVPKGQKHTLYFKYSVVQEYRRMQKLKSRIAAACRAEVCSSRRGRRIRSSASSTSDSSISAEMSVMKRMLAITRSRRCVGLTRRRSVTT